MNRVAIAWVGAGVLAVAGIVVAIVGLVIPVGVASFGWFAYQPLADATFMPGNGGLFLSRVAVIGFAVLGVGLLALAFLAGWRVGAKRRG